METAAVRALARATWVMRRNVRSLTGMPRAAESSAMASDDTGRLGMFPFSWLYCSTSMTSCTLSDVSGESMGQADLRGCRTANSGWR